MPKKSQNEQAELQALIKQQRIDRANQSRSNSVLLEREKFGGQRTVGVSDSATPALNPLDLLPETNSTDPQVILFQEKETSEMIEAVSSAVARLPKDHQELYRMIYAEQLTLEQAGAELGISRQAVHKRLRTLHKSVQSLLENAAANGISAE